MTAPLRRQAFGAPAATGTAHIGFIMEQTLGHRTHAANLREIIERESSITPTWMPVAWETTGLGASLPVFRNNWTVRAGLRARRALSAAYRRQVLDAVFVHTQVPAVLLGRWLQRVPTVISLDATPRQYDGLGESYAHATGGPRTEALKWQANRRCFERAFALVTWSEWTRRSLIDEYEVPSEKVTVIPPGVRTGEWARPEGLARRDDEVRILFVGGDLERKGGTTLLEAFRALRAEATRPGSGMPPLALHLVTQTPMASEPGVTAHHGLMPNSAELRHLYHQADVFCLPTRGDCLPMVLSEAGAAGLPLIATDVGALSEIVRDGETGRLVPVDDVDALATALRELVGDSEARQRMGAAAADLVSRQFDAERNAHRLLHVLHEAAASAR